MMIPLSWLFNILLISQPLFSKAFVVPATGLRSTTTDFRGHVVVRDVHRTWGLAASSSADEENPVENPVEQFSEERKQNLFQFLLRDLQVEGVPLLGCDADQTHILQAAMWTTMAELSEKDTADKTCMIFENIPMDPLRAFVDDFGELKTESRLLDALPELQRFNVSLVGKGIGPAILIATGNRTDSEKATYDSVQENTAVPDELKWTSAMKMFVSRMMSGLEVGLESRDIESGPLAYRLSGSLDMCDTMSAFWNCVCELLSLPEEELGSTILCIPPPPTGVPNFDAEARFSAVSELMNRSLRLYRGDGIFSLNHMHPNYSRQSIHPKDGHTQGHLPPTRWLRVILKHNGNADEAEKLTNDQLELQDYQRRSPLPAVVIERVSQLNAATTPENEAVQLDLGDGKVENASGVSMYARNVIRMASEGKASLQSALEAEIALTL
jgi:hypothetical protein